MKFRFKVDTTYVYEVEVEDEDTLRDGIAEGCYMEAKGIVETWSGPDVWDIQKVER